MRRDADSSSERALPMRFEPGSPAAEQVLSGLAAVAAFHRRGDRHRRYAAAGHDGQHRGDRGAAEDPGRAEPVRRRPQLGDHRLCADLRRSDAARRPSGRHDRAQAHLHRRRRTVHHRLGAVRYRLGRNHFGDRPAVAGRRRGDRLADRPGADRHHVPQGPGPKCRDRDLRRDDRCRLRDGPGGRWRAGRGVLAAGVPGERPDRPADDLPGPHDAAGDPARADEARCRRRAAGHRRVYRRGVRLRAGPRERLALDGDTRLRRDRHARLHRIRVRRAPGGQPGGSVHPVQGPQPAGDVRRGVPGRRRDVHADRADRPVRAGHHGLQRAARRRSASSRS